MERCIYCQKFILPNNRIALPTSRERRIAFAAALELDEATILNLPKLRYLCTSHFLPTDFYRNDENKITGLQRSALPRQNNPQISENPTFPHLQSFNHLSTVTTAVIPPLSFHPNLSLPKTSITSPTLIMPQSKDIENVPTDDFSNDFDVSDDFGENNDNEINAKINYDKQNEKKKEDIRPKKKYKKFVEPIINLDEMDTFLLNKKKDLMEEEIDEDDDERVEYVVISTKRLLSIFTACPICHAILGNTKKMIKIIGTAASITFRCSECLPNPKTWATQDKIQGTKIYTGNALLSSAAIITPVPFTTLKQLFNLSRIGIFGNCRYKKTAKNVTWPVVKNFYDNEHTEMLKMLKDRNGAVNILMDGQYDSPGYCAMMCKVTAIDAKSGYAVGIQTLQRTMTENKSARMEIEGVRRIMKEMENNGVHVDRATTDRNTGVIALFREEFPKTQHKNDTWHMVKGVKKDLMNESKKKRSQDLAAYVPLIKNHFWYSVEKANGDGEMCREILLSGLFHLIGIHKWKKGKICKQLKMYILRIIGKDDESYNQFLKKNPDNCSKFFKELKFERITQCCHEPIDPKIDDNEYMNPVGMGYYSVLIKLTPEKFLKDVIKCSPDLSTSKVENFNSIATGIYTPKKTYFPYDSYTIRSMLTVLHYNNNERCEKNGTRTVLRTVQYPSKAQGGELVKKKIKSKAPITYKHSMMSKCLEVFENGSTILGTETNYSAEEVESEEELEQEWPERNAESDEESNESIIGDHDEAQLENNDESELTESSSEEEELMEESMEESNFVEEPIVDDSSIHPFSSPSKASDFDFSRKRKADFEESTSKFKMSKIESSLQSSDLQSVTEQPKKQVASQSDPDLIIIKDCGMPQNVYTFTPPTEIFLQTVCQNIKIDIETMRNSPLLKMPPATRFQRPTKLYNPRGDGNCGWRAIAYLFLGDEDYHWLLRIIITRWRALCREKEAIEMWDKIQGKDAFNTLRDKSLWMSDQDILAIAKYFNVNILNFTEEKEPHWKCFSPGRRFNTQQKEGYPDLCIYYSSSHYQAIIEIDSSV